MQKTSLFDRLGGAPAIHAVLELFYAKVLVDPDLKGFFEHIDLEKAKAHERDFFAKVFDGPDNYKGRDLVTIHKNMGVKDAHFDKAKEYITLSLKELNVPKEMIAEVEGIVESVRKMVAQG